MVVRIPSDEPIDLLDQLSLPVCELVVVMPVHNEAEGLERCVRSWLTVLDELAADYQLLVIDDGSTDESAAVLNRLGRHSRVVPVSKTNEGHGPTILRGYRLATGRAGWVFQVDSDDEIPAAAFPPLWLARHGMDAVFGARIGRGQDPVRRVISVGARLTSRLLGGRASDVNVPFRLLRSDALAPVVAAIPADTFAPNVVIAAALSRNRRAFTEVEVEHRHRRTGQVSIAGWGALRAAARSLVQAVRLVGVV